MRIISPEEENRFLRHAPPTLRDVSILMLQTGMRPNEVFSIRGENVSLEHQFIFVPDGKTRFARRTIPLTEPAREVLKRRLRERYIFPHRTKPGRPMTTLAKTPVKLCKKLNLKFRLYDLRHTFGSRAAMAGVDLPTRKELMGHSTITMTMRYIHPTPQHKIEALEKLQNFRTPTKSPTVLK